MTDAPDQSKNCNQLIEEADKLVGELTVHISFDEYGLSSSSTDLSEILYAPKAGDEEKKSAKLIPILTHISSLLTSGTGGKLSNENSEKWKKIEPEWEKYQKRKDYEIRFKGHDEILSQKYLGINTLSAEFDSNIVRLNTTLSTIYGIHSTLDKAIQDLDRKMKGHAAAQSVHDSFKGLGQTFANLEKESRVEKQCLNDLERSFGSLKTEFDEADNNFFQLNQLAENLPDIKRASTDEYRSRVEFHRAQVEEKRQKLEARRQLVTNHRQQVGSRIATKNDLFRRIESYRHPLEEYDVLMTLRKNRQRNIICLLFLLLFTAIGIYVIWKTTSNVMYRERLQAIINSNSTPSDEGFALLAEIEKKAPRLRKSDEILKLEEALKVKRQNEEESSKHEQENEAAFEKLKLEFLEELKDVQRNNASLKSMLNQLAALASPKLENELDSLKKSYSAERAKYLKSQENEYRRFYDEAEKIYANMIATIDAHDFDSARPMIKEINSLLDNADNLPDISQSLKNELLPMRGKYSRAAELLEQNRFEYSFTCQIIELEKQLKFFAECIESQDYAAAKKTRDVLLNQSQEKISQLDDTQNKVNSALAKRLSTLHVTLANLDARLSELDQLLQREYSELKTILAKKNLEDIRVGLKNFLVTYPHFYEKATVEELLKGIALKAPELAEYDKAIISWGKEFDQQYTLLKEELRKILLNKSNEYKQNPTFLMSFKNKETNGIVDFYMQSDADKNGIRFQKKGIFSKDFSIHVLGFDKPIVLNLANQELKLPDRPTIKMTVAYPQSEKTQYDFSEVYNFMGPCGEWLTSLQKNDAIEITDVNGRFAVDNTMKTQLQGEVDIARAALLWQSILNELFSACNREFGKGGKFEATELVTFKEQLDSAIAALPQGYKWFSLGWEHPQALSTLASTLKNSTIKEPFFNSFSHLEEKQQSTLKKTTPVAILYSKNKYSQKKEWALNQLEPIDGKGFFFIVDTTTKTTIPVVSFDQVKFNMKWNVLKDTNLDKNCYLLFVKK